MKSNCKKTLAILLAVLMLVCAFPFAVFADNHTTHTYDQTKKEAAYLKEAGTCTKKAVYYKSCTCGASSKDATNETFEGDIDPDNHVNIDPKVDAVAATCYSDGKTAIGKCKDCGKDYVGGKIISKDTVPHTQKTAANCVDLAVCSVCGKTYGKVDPNNHKNVVKDAAKPATCIATGLTEGSHCEACKKTIKAQETVPLTAHTPTMENKAATCTEDGVLNKSVCSVCKVVLAPGTVLPKTGHKWGNWTLPDGFTCATGGVITHTCSVCKISETVTKKPGEHDLITDPAVPATCTKDGKSDGSHCGICNAVIKEQTVVPATGHNFTGEVKGNKDGTHSFKCVNCNEIGGAVKCEDLDRNCVCDRCRESIPHTFSFYTPDGNATCMQDGTKTAVCDICGKVKDTQPDVGSKDKAPHSFKYVAQNDATCMVNAHEIGTCSLCGKTETREIENTALGHDISDWKYPEGFSCPNGGTRYKECKRCGEKTQEEAVAPADHIWVEDPAVQVTCTVNGKTKGSHCSVCGEVFTAQAVIPAQGHKADAKGFTVVKAATCTASGEEKATCSVCGESFTHEIPKTGHKYVITVVPATCTAKGYTNHKCSVCGSSFNDNKVKATGHTWKITVKQATMKKAGAKVYVCSVCKKKVTKAIDMISTVKLAATDYAKTGKKITPTLVVKNSAGKKLKEGTAYTVKYSGNRKNLGTYTLTVTFIGNYKGSKTLKFRIIPAAPKTVKATASGKNVTVNWSKVSGGDKYVVYCSTSKDSGYKKVGTATKTTLTVKNLKTGTYYLKVRAVNTSGSATLNGTLSAPVKVKVK